MIKIRRMTKEDIPAAVEIERVCFSEPWSEKVYSATLLLPYAHYYVAQEESGNIVGTCGVKLILGEGEIGNVAVLPAYRGRGIARKLMERMLTDAGQESAEAFTLEVRAGNVPAIRLYESFGFRQEGIRKRFYRDPEEDALILWKR